MGGGEGQHEADLLWRIISILKGASPAIQRCSALRKERQLQNPTEFCIRASDYSTLVDGDDFIISTPRKLVTIYIPRLWQRYFQPLKSLSRVLCPDTIIIWLQHTTYPPRGRVLHFTRKTKWLVLRRFIFRDTC